MGGFITHRLPVDCWIWAAGVIDAAKVTRSALQNAGSIAALFLTTEAVVADAPEGADHVGHDHGHDF